MSGPVRLPDWDHLAITAPDVVATMRRYLGQLACVLRPGSVGGADLALRSLATFLTEQAPDVVTVADISRRHIEDFIRWLAARPGRNQARVTPATLAHRLGTLRMFGTGIQRRYGKRPSTPTHRTSTGTAARDDLGDHRWHERGDHHDHPRPGKAVTRRDRQRVDEVFKDA